MSKRKFQAPRGTYDVLPEDQVYFKYIYDIIDQEAQNAGFLKIDTPIFEDADLFTRGIGEATDIIEKEMYLFSDRSDNKLALRPEMTAPVVRAYLEEGLQSRPHPVKLYYYGPMFRYERPQAGRFRQFYQFGFEAIGDQNPVVDAQMIALAARIIKKTGILDEFSVQIGSIGCPTCRVKYQKFLVNHYKEKKDQLCVDCLKRLAVNPLRLLDCKVSACQPVKEGAPHFINHLCKNCHDHLRSVLEYLDEIDLVYDLNPFLVRGLDYYTKTTFEIWPDATGQSALLGGGRYDGLVELLGGKPTPAIGFGAGIERIVELLKQKEVEIPQKDDVKLFVAQLGAASRKICFKLIEELQDAGIGALGSFGKQGIGEQLRAADRLNAPLVILVGQKEVYDGTVILKHMDSGVQEIIPQEKIVKTLLKRLKI